MKQLIILNSKAKSFAYCLDYGATSNEDKVYLDLTRVERFRPISFKRRKLQSKLIERDSSALKTFHKNALFEIICIIRCIKAFIHFKNNPMDKTILGSQERFRLLQCRISAYMGSRFFDHSEVRFRTFYKHFSVNQRVEYFIKKNLFSIVKSEDQLVLYNGREPLEATLIFFAKQSGLSVRILERGSSNSRYQLFPTSPHFHPDWWKLITEYNKSNPAESTNHATDAYIKNRLSGYDTYFEEDWSKKKLPILDVSRPDKLDQRNYVLFYTSSTTEYSPVPEYNCDLGYKTQFQVVVDLISICHSMSLPLVIRRHPNSLGVDGVDREEGMWKQAIESTPGAHLIYYGPKVPLSSYSLIEDSRCVVVWKSSIGFETMALGKPTIATATAKWSWFPSLRAWSKNDLYKFISNPVLLNEYKEVVREFAGFMANSGTKTTFFTEINKWGFITTEGDTVYNFIGERIGRKIESIALNWSGKPRRRNA